ncbi:hypothetical protein SK128_005354 [Halocaridina rubra]|uniref:Uncharacterized protein n=1 Tax=Halocaridina rubra TaxID=373956 RepID=A0AAN8WV22_HALRR
MSDEVGVYDRKCLIKHSHLESANSTQKKNTVCSNHENNLLRHGQRLPEINVQRRSLNILVMRSSSCD